MKVRKLVPVFLIACFLIACTKETDADTVFKEDETTEKEQRIQIKDGDVIINYSSNEGDLTGAVNYKPMDYIIGLDGVQFSGLTYSRVTRATMVINHNNNEYYYSAWGGKEIEIQGKKVIIKGLDIYKDTVALQVID